MTQINILHLDNLYKFTIVADFDKDMKNDFVYYISMSKILFPCHHFKPECIHRSFTADEWFTVIFKYWLSYWYIIKWDICEH